MQEDYETCPRCGKKAIQIREIKTFDDPLNNINV